MAFSFETVIGIGDRSIVWSGGKVKREVEEIRCERPLGQGRSMASLWKLCEGLEPSQSCFGGHCSALSSSGEDYVFFALILRNALEAFSASTLSTL
jgi:hypothetical protein